MGDIAQAHTKVVDDVDPLPAAGAGDDIHAVEHVVEYAVDVGPGQGLIAAHGSALAHGVINVVQGAHVLGVECGVVVKADVGVLGENFGGHGLLFRVKLHHMTTCPVPLSPLEVLVILAGLQVIVGGIALVGRLLLEFHDNQNSSRYLIRPQNKTGRWTSLGQTASPRSIRMYALAYLA